MEGVRLISLHNRWDYNKILCVSMLLKVNILKELYNYGQHNK